VARAARTEGRGEGELTIHTSVPREDHSSLATSLENLHTTAITARLGERKSELVRLQNRRDQIQEMVLRKMQLGMTYDDAWQSIKRQHPTWFE
jgi:hypothetical protein